MNEITELENHEDLDALMRGDVLNLVEKYFGGASEKSTCSFHREIDGIFEFTVPAKIGIEYLRVVGAKKKNIKVENNQIVIHEDSSYIESYTNYNDGYYELNKSLNMGGLREARFKLDKDNTSDRAMMTPSLKELLENKYPFVISCESPIRTRKDYVFSQLFEGADLILNGVWLIDQDATYTVDRGETTFKKGESKTPWHLDKFRVMANWYQTNLSPDQLKEEFKDCGYTFEVRE